MEHLCILSEQEKQKVKEYLVSNEKFQPLSPSEKNELKEMLFKFIKRICFYPRYVSQGEIALLPELIKILLELR